MEVGARSRLPGKTIKKQGKNKSDCKAKRKKNRMI